MSVSQWVCLIFSFYCDHRAQTSSLSSWISAIELNRFNRQQSWVRIWQMFLADAWAWRHGFSQTLILNKSSLNNNLFLGTMDWIRLQTFDSKTDPKTKRIKGRMGMTGCKPLNSSSKLCTVMTDWVNNPLSQIFINSSWNLSNTWILFCLIATELWPQSILLKDMYYI